MPPATHVTDAESRWADAGLLSPVSVFTPSLQAIGREAKRAGEEAKYLAELDPLGKVFAAARRALTMLKISPHCARQAGDSTAAFKLLLDLARIQKRGW